MPTIYKRFMEKEAREWRQIYKVSSGSFPFPSHFLALFHTTRVLR